jgi:hypothetical protein
LVEVRDKVMKKRLQDLLPNLSTLVSQERLFLAYIRYVGLNVAMMFYHFIDEDTVTTTDIFLFDIAEETVERVEIIDPKELHYVIGMDISDDNVHGRKTLLLKLRTETKSVSYKVFFSEAAFHLKTMPVQTMAG